MTDTNNRLWQKAGVLTGSEAWQLSRFLQSKGAALPAVNVTSPSTVNAALETAAKLNSPIIIQISNGGAGFFAGKSLDTKNPEITVSGAISAALHVHTMAPHYGVPVVLHTDHAARTLLPWIDGLLEAGAEYKQNTGRPLFTSHMIDLSAEPLADNLVTSVEYARKMTDLDMLIEIELGMTGGEEDGVDHTDVDAAHLYTQPADIIQAHDALAPVTHGGHFWLAAAFGNVHGVYKPGNVTLTPKILHEGQQAILNHDDALDSDHSTDLPLVYVFHGGSGSSRADIREAISYGVIKMNIDTDLQWAYWDGVRLYNDEKHAYLQSQIGNPDGIDKPNKKAYDPRVWLREAEKSFVTRLHQSFDDLNAVGLLTS